MRPRAAPAPRGPRAARATRPQLLRFIGGSAGLRLRGTEAGNPVEHIEIDFSKRFMASCSHDNTVRYAPPPSRARLRAGGSAPRGGLARRLRSTFVKRLWRRGAFFATGGRSSSGTLRFSSRRTGTTRTARMPAVSAPRRLTPWIEKRSVSRSFRAGSALFSSFATALQS